MSAKTVFISYRRDSAGRPLARLLQQALMHRGYDVFLDVFSLVTGDWKAQLLDGISQRAHFLLIVSPGALDRCAEPDDMVRCEYEAAVAARRNVVPVFEESVDVAQARQKCPEPLRGLFDLEGARIGHQTFEADLDALIARFLSPQYAPRPAEPAMVPGSSSNEPEVQQPRRIDAMVPARTTMGRNIDLVVQVRLGTSKRLGGADYELFHELKREDLRRASQPIDLVFPRDGRTGSLGHAELELEVWSDDFEVLHGNTTRILVPPGPRFSPLVSFVLRPLKEGDRTIYLRARDSNRHQLGTVPLMTRVGREGEPLAETPQLNGASLELEVRVEREAEVAPRPAARPRRRRRLAAGASMALLACAGLSLFLARGPGNKGRLAIDGVPGTAFELVRLDGSLVRTGLGPTRLEVPVGDYFVTLFGTGDWTAYQQRISIEPRQRMALTARFERSPKWTNVLGMEFARIYGTNVYLATTRTRVADYAAFARANGIEWLSASNGFPDDHPVVGVTWRDAERFCEWLTERDRASNRLDAYASYVPSTNLMAGLDNDLTNGFRVLVSRRPE